MPDLISISDIFILPSVKEGLSLSLLEAMYMKKICMVAKNETMEEVITDGKTGITFEENNYDVVVGKILEVINNIKSFSALGEEASKIVERRYNSSCAVKTLEDTYIEILNYKNKK